MLIHATITISGEETALIACAARMRRRLSAHYLKDEVTEHHGEQALCYDLKIEGGIPFPLFADASQEFPELQFAAEWVNVAAGQRGSATLVNGRVVTQETQSIAVSESGGHPLYVSVADDGVLTLALIAFRASREEWRGYVLTSARDALLRVVRLPGADTVELYATEGSPEWTLAWHGESSSELTCHAVTPPIPLGESVFSELDALARDFVADWIWFSSAPDEEIAIEKERYAQHGYAVSDANVRSIKLKRMKDTSISSGGPLVYSTLTAEDEWVKDLVLATWAKEQG
jgi:hypothetical protein